MSTASDSARKLLVVVDGDFGDRLRDAWRGQPVWITMSAANAPVVQALWANARNSDHLTGITGFKHVEECTSEDRFLAELYTIDLHHGPYSTNTPYTTLTVIGAPLTKNIRTALLQLGFCTFQQQPDRFVTNRSEEEANRVRD